MRNPWLIIFLLSVSGTIISQNREIDSLEQLLKAHVHDTVKIKAMTSLSIRYKNKGDYEKATTYSLDALKLSEVCGSKNGEAKAYDNLGLIKENQGFYGEAMDYFKKSLDIRTALHDKLLMASTNSNMGLVFYDEGNYPKALEHFLTAIKLNEEGGKPKYSYAPLSNIGNIYFSQKNFDEALRYYEKVAKILEDMPAEERNSIYQKMLASNYNNLGGALIEKQQVGKGLSYYYKALEIHEKTGYKIGWANSLNNIGRVYLQLKDYTKAGEMLEKTLKLKEEIGDKTGIGDAYMDLSLLELKQDHLKEALAIGLKGLENIDGSESPSDAMDAEKQLSEIYERMHDPKNALLHYKTFIRYRDSIYNEENTKKITRTEMNYEFEKKEAAAKLVQEKKEAVAAAESKKQRIVIWCVCSLLLVAALFAIYAYRSYLAKQRSNIEITRQKEIIEEKQKEIIDSIHYAQRIQKALLPTERLIEKDLRKLT